MRILIINWQDLRNPLSGGAEVHLHNIFSRIARRGHDVTLLCSRAPGLPPVEKVDGMTVIRGGGRHLFNFHVPFAYRSLVRDGSFDVVVDDVNKIPFFTPLFVRLPLCGIVHHLFGRSIFLETNPLAAAYVAGMEWLGLRVYRAASMPFFVVSASTRQEMQDHGFPPGDLEVVQNCVDHHLYTPDPSRRSATPLLGVFGRMKKYKFVDHVLRAMPGVLRQVPDTKLVVVGEGDDRPRLERLSVELGLGEAVTFTGFVTDADKVAYLQRMWFAVTTSSKEGWGLTVLEANACGTPVIASDVPGLRDAVLHEQTGILTPFGDIPALERNILRMLSDGALRERFGEASREWAATFDWDRAAENTITVLESVIASHHARTVAPA